MQERFSRWTDSTWGRHERAFERLQNLLEVSVVAQHAILLNLEVSLQMLYPLDVLRYLDVYKPAAVVSGFYLSRDITSYGLSQSSSNTEENILPLRGYVATTVRP